MDLSGFNTGRAVAIPVVPRQGVVFGKAAAIGKLVVGIAGDKAVAGLLPGSGCGPAKQTFKGARPGAQVSNADTEQNVHDRKPSPTRMRKSASAPAHLPVKQNSGGAIFSYAELQRSIKSTQLKVEIIEKRTKS